MHKNGFILLEVLLSLVILGLVLVTSIQAISGFVRSTASSGNINIATALSQQLLARVGMREFRTGISNGNLGEDHPGFSWEVNKTEMTDSEAQYEISVIWNEHGLKKDLKLITSRFEPKNII